MFKAKIIISFIMRKGPVMPRPKVLRNLVQDIFKVDLSDRFFNKLL
jgi:hypothetical protein